MLFYFLPYTFNDKIDLFNIKNDYAYSQTSKYKEYEIKQSTYDVAPRLPFAQIITGPSGSGKGTLLQSMKLDIYRNVFERVYVWSPAVSVDSNWTPVKKYIQDELKVDLEKEKCFFDEYILELERVIKQ